MAWSALTSIPFVGKLTEQVKSFGDDLGLGAVKGTLAKLAVRALERALGTLRKLIHSALVERVWKAAAELADGLDRDKAAGPLLVGGLLGCEGVKQAIAARLEAAGLDQARLDTARGELADLGERFGKRMDLVAVMITAAAALLTAVASPLAAAGAAVLLLGVSLVLAADYADAWRLPVAVRGVRTVVEEATA